LGRCVAGKYYSNLDDTYRGIGGRTYVKLNNSVFINEKKCITEISKNSIILTEKMKDELLFSYNNHFECIEGIYETLKILGIEIEGINED
jgi:hypothetical protein